MRSCINIFPELYGSECTHHIFSRNNTTVDLCKLHVERELTLKKYPILDLRKFKAT